MKRIQSNKNNLDQMFSALQAELERLKKENEKLSRARVVETKADGLESLLGQYVQLWCLNYIYSGKLVGVNTNDVVLAEAVVVYETGKLTDKNFKFAEPVSAEEHFVRTALIESYSLAPQLVK